MAKDTTSNHGRAIATRGTAHVARTPGELDYCYDEKLGKSSPKLFENYIPTEGYLHVPTNSTAKTLINRYRIWIDGGRVGAPGFQDSFDPRPTHQIGYFTDEPYRGEAWNVSCSSDLYVEGKGVVRTDDITKQNRGNTFGHVDGSEVEVTRELTEAFYLRACEIVSLEGMTMRDEDARMERVEGVLGDPGFTPVTLGKKEPDATGDDDYLEIFNGEGVELTVTRQDGTQEPPVVDPPCKIDRFHAYWAATRTYEGEVAEKHGSGKTLTLDKSFTDVGLTPSVTQSIEELGIVIEMKGTEDDLIAAFRANDNAPQIVATATACAGARSVTLAIKPKGAYSVSIRFPNRRDEFERGNAESSYSGLDTFSVYLEKLRRLDQITSVIEEVANKASRGVPGISFSWEFKLFAGLKLELGCEYKRCERDGEGFTTACIRRAHHFSVEGEIIKLVLSGRFELIQLGLLFFPTGGAAVSRALSELELEVFYVDLTFEIACSAAFSMAVDQHGDFGPNTIERSATITISVSLKAVLDLGLVELSVEVKGSTTGQLVMKPLKLKGILCEATWNVSFASEVTFTGRRWIFKASKTFAGAEWKPDPQPLLIPLLG